MTAGLKLTRPHKSFFHALQGVCAGIIIFSMQTKFDFTKCGGLLFVLLWVLILYGFITIFTWYRSWVSHVLLSG